MTLTVNETNGDDTYNWNSTDHNLNLDGKEGSDTLNVYASDANHVVNFSENGRYEAVIADQNDQARVTTYSVETINYHGLGGDTINIADMFHRTRPEITRRARRRDKGKGKTRGRPTMSLASRCPSTRSSGLARSASCPAWQDRAGSPRRPRRRTPGGGAATHPLLQLS